ncbi:hypothetical protein [Vibrio vulnificus YJ016]|uniref:Uncharacterized protein n=1 Tax=Vibrio vulnificus (strain YJ016) TaxID=196600 RepID=Q7MKH1_VIBVY|nr:hypothetical protein [Vibrio vulnificus YJ016]
MLHFVYVLHNFTRNSNAALSGEQRHPPNLNHCDVNTKAESN